MSQSNPYFNLAAEAHFLSQLDCAERDYVFIYVNQPAVVVGRNQNIYEEVNLAFCAQENIVVCRRISGGGTVYHDLGNINIAWFSRSDMSKVNNYAHAMQPLIAFLKTFGITAHLNERNSLMIGEKKIGGNAQFSSKNNLLSHCTLLFDSDLDKLEKSIEPSFREVSSHAGKSVRSKVINLKNVLEDNISIDEFIVAMQTFFAAQGIGVLQLDELATKEIQSNHEPKLQSFDWLYARSPACEISLPFEGQAIKVLVNKGCISSVMGEGMENIFADWIGKAFVYDPSHPLFRTKA